MKTQLVILCVTEILIASLVQGKHEAYDGYKTYRVKIKSSQQLAAVMAFEDIDLWSYPTEHNKPGVVMVSPARQQAFESLLQHHNVHSDVHTDNVYRYLNELDKKLTITNSNTGNKTFTFDAYYGYDEIVEYLEQMERQHSEHMTVSNAEITAEGRPIKVVRLSTTNFDPLANKPVMIVEGGINGREWTSSQAALHVIRSLLDASQPRPSFFLQVADWVVVPVLNPDGLEYTRTNLRLWTKSRSTSSYLGHVCPGVHVNRNFDAAWMSTGASSSPCSDIYAGAAPFSEPESRVVRALLAEHAGRVALYVSVQSNGGFLTYPWRHTAQTNPAITQLHYLAGDIVRGMSSSEAYAIGSAALTLGAAASGTSTDYVHAAGVSYVYNLELAEYGGDGILVPEADLPNVLDDVWRAISRASTFFYMGIASNHI